MKKTIMAAMFAFILLLPIKPAFCEEKLIIIDAVRLDTNSVLSILYYLVIPFSVPALCTLLMLCFSECCAMIEQPLILLNPAKNIMPLSVEMNSIYRLFPNVIFAASILFVSPCLLLYLFVKKPMIKTMNELTL